MTNAILLICRTCGGMVGVTADVDSTKHRRDVARFVGDGIRQGYRVEHTTAADVREGKHPWCECIRAKRRAKKSQLELTATPPTGAPER
jgi:hypothetical protein